LTLQLHSASLGSRSALTNCYRIFLVSDSIVVLATNLLGLPSISRKACSMPFAELPACSTVSSRSPPENRSLPGRRFAVNTSGQVTNAVSCAGMPAIGHGLPSHLQGPFRLGEQRLGSGLRAQTGGRLVGSVMRMSLGHRPFAAVSSGIDQRAQEGTRCHTIGAARELHSRGNGDSMGRCFRGCLRGIRD
jgi:hypothetical protein